MLRDRYKLYISVILFSSKYLHDVQKCRDSRIAKVQTIKMQLLQQRQGRHDFFQHAPSQRPSRRIVRQIQGSDPSTVVFQGLRESAKTLRGRWGDEQDWIRSDNIAPRV
jgi:hypothetical protein